MDLLKKSFVQFFEYIHQAVSSVIANPNISYGVTIIFVTIVIKILVLPLYIKQTKSALAMSELQPEIKKLQDKYKGDPKKSQEEMMKLYKEKGANPLSSCLPMLIQWPIFIALYYVFFNLTGINGIKFLWIQDLAKRDIPLILLSSITTYISGKLMMPATGDSAQAKQTQFMNVSMSVFMLFISWNLTSALVLYWVVSNSIQILQTIVIKKLGNKKSVKA